MFRRAVTLGRIAGIPIRVDGSWVVIALLVTWSLAAGFFPAFYGAIPPQAAWGLALVGALGLFFSILFHEFAHALVARRFGVEVTSITLFIFGGVGEIERDPPTPSAEFWIAVVGPASSSLLAILCAIPFLALSQASLPLFVHALLHWLLLVNTMLAAFNMVPAFPLDGGHVLRAFLWAGTGSLRRATRSASRAGELFALLLMFLGAFQFLGGNWLGGVWFFIIGLWLRQAASGSYRQLLLKEMLAGSAVRDFMQKDPVAVPPDLTVERLVDDYVYRFHHKMFPVVENGILLGCVTLQQVGATPPAERGSHRVRELMIPRSEDNSVAADTDVMDALAKMNRTGNSRLLVSANGSLVGVLTLKDVMAFFALKVQLEGEPAEEKR